MTRSSLVSLFLIVMLAGSSCSSTQPESDAAPPEVDQGEPLETGPGGPDSAVWLDGQGGGCPEGQKRCSGNDAEQCSGGRWVKQTCPNGCVAGICIGGDCNCGIPAAGLKVSFPWVTLTPPTVVKVTGSCYVGTNPNPCGHKSASYHKVLSYTGSSVSIKDMGGGILWYIDFPLGQAAASSGELGALASSTGLPLAELQKSGADETLVITDPPKPVSYAAPAGVQLTAFLPSSPTSPGYVRFSSSSQPSLTSVMNDLGTGITVDLTVRYFMGSGQWVYRCKLTKSGLQVTAISK